MKSSMFFVSVVGIILHSYAPLFATDPPTPQDPQYALVILLKDRDKPLSSSDEVEVARLLRRGNEEYLIKLKSINSMSFRQQKSLSAEQAVAFKEEIDIVKEHLSTLLPFYDEIEKSQESFSVLAWLAIAQVVAEDIPYMNDIDRAGLIESKWPTGLQLALRGIVGRLIYPKVVALVRSRQEVRTKPKG